MHSKTLHTKPKNLKPPLKSLDQPLAWNLSRSSALSSSEMNTQAAFMAARRTSLSACPRHCCGRGGGVQGVCHYFKDDYRLGHPSLPRHCCGRGGGAAGLAGSVRGSVGTGQGKGGDAREAPPLVAEHEHICGRSPGRAIARQATPRAAGQGGEAPRAGGGLRPRCHTGRPLACSTPLRVPMYWVRTFMT